MTSQETRVDIGDFFGYTHLVRQSVFVAMAGDGAQLQIGTIVRLRADRAGYLRNFRDGETVVIVGFQMPFTDGCTDYVVLVSDGARVSEIKPQSIDAIVAAAPRQLRIAASSKPESP